MAELGRANEQPQGGPGARCAAPVAPLTRRHRSRRSRAVAARWAAGGIVESHLRLVALQGEEYPAPRRPGDDAVGGPGRRAGGEARRARGLPSDRDEAAGLVNDLRGWRSGDSGSERRTTWRTGRAERAGEAERRARVEQSGEAEQRVELSGLRERRAAGRRPVRLTRRGRLVLLALVLLTAALVGFLGAAPGQAADPPRPAVTAVVQPGDTLWSFAERNLPEWKPKAAITELKRLNDLEGYVIHPGQRLVLPARR